MKALPVYLIIWIGLMTFACVYHFSTPLQQDTHRTIYAADLIDPTSRIAFASGDIAYRGGGDSIAPLSQITDPDWVPMEIIPAELTGPNGPDSCVLQSPSGSFRGWWSSLVYDVPASGKVDVIWGTDTLTWIEDQQVCCDLSMPLLDVISEHINGDSIVIFDSVKVVSGVMYLDFIILIKNHTGAWNTGTDYGLHLLWPGVRYVPMLMAERRLYFGALATGNVEECIYMLQQCPSFTATGFFSAQIDTADAKDLYDFGILFNCKTGVDRCDLRGQYMDSVYLAQFHYQQIFPLL